MGRIEFDGQGSPIPAIALPPFGSESDLPPTILIFTESQLAFSVEQYRELGFTHFEVWAVGAAGGRGGGVLLGDPGDPIYNHGTVKSTSYGGEGGGGGLHFVSGLLADLPDEVPIGVGVAGANGQNGNRAYRWRVATAMMGTPPSMRAVVRGDTNIPGMTDGAGNAIPPYFFAAEDWFASSAYLFYPNPDYVAPTNGVDGGASSFNAPLCRASGGKGGKKSPVYRNHADDSQRTSIYMEEAPGGDGGEGGAGNRLLAGGGALGASTNPIAFFDVPGQAYPPGYSYGSAKPWVLNEAKDGSWNGSIGQGGGGGRGGSTWTDPGVPPSFQPTTTTHPASRGGRGSFSYGDTSVYGHAGGLESQIIAGAGGGARPTKNHRYGSRASTYSPGGVVVLRLTRIV